MSDQLRIGLAGAGPWARRVHAPALATLSPGPVAGPTPGDAHEKPV